MAIRITILGSNSAIPTANRRPTAQIVSVNNDYFLLDCGEGTQIQLRKYGIKFQRISRIFISHLHGDHYFGLIGLINTMHLLNREKELHIHAPAGLQEIIEIQLKAASTYLRYPLHFHSIDSGQIVFEDQKVTVTAPPVDHRIDCFGFVFQEKPYATNIRKEAIDEYGLSLEQIIAVKADEEIRDERNEVIPRDKLVLPPQKPRKYAFITDTKPSKSYFEAIADSDLLYHESTFMDDMEKRAKETYHTTATQAAQVALDSGCKKLILGHFSTRYDKLEPLLQEAKNVFENTELAVEGSRFDV